MQELMDEYLTMLQVESGCAANTLAAYRRDLRKLADFFQEEGLTDLQALTKPLWIQFLNSLKTCVRRNHKRDTETMGTASQTLV
jgi:integrase/recombinase XerD